MDRDQPPPFKPGDAVRITSGVWQGFSAEVIAIDPERGRAECEIPIHGRRIPVEAELSQLERDD